jgi:hypothetical protein
MNKWSRKKYMLEIACLLLLVVVSIFSAPVSRLIVKTSDLLGTVLPSVLVELANVSRKNIALKSLTLNPILERAAQLKASDMAAKSYFAHYSPEGLSPWHFMREAGYDFIFAGENLAVNFDESESVNSAWLASPTHKANIVNNRFTEVGIATAKGYYQGRETTFVVQMFGLPTEELASVTNSEDASSSEENLNQIFLTASNPPLAGESTRADILGESGSELFIAVENTARAPTQSPALTNAEILTILQKLLQSLLF